VLPACGWGGSGERPIVRKGRQLRKFGIWNPAKRRSDVFWEAEQPVVVFKQVEGRYKMHRIHRTASTVAGLWAWITSANQQIRPTPAAEDQLHFRISVPDRIRRIDSGDDGTASTFLVVVGIIREGKPTMRSSSSGFAASTATTRISRSTHDIKFQIRYHTSERISRCLPKPIIQRSTIQQPGYHIAIIHPKSPRSSLS
jgi:hypothetical protein